MASTFAAAFELHRAGRLAEAEAAYRALLSTSPDDAQLLMHLGLVVAEMGRLEEGKLLLEQAALRDPSQPLAHYHLATVVAALGQHEEALAGFSAALTLQLNFFEALAAKGDLLLGLGRFGDAAEAFRQASEMAPDRVEMLLNLGTALQECGRFEEALTVCDQALQRAPGHPSALNNRGNTLRLVGRLEEALLDFDRAIAAAPSYALARFNRATVLDALDQHEAALAECERALGYVPQHAPSHHLRGTILLALYRNEEALAAFEKALAIRPDMIEAWHGRIGALIKLTRWEEALSAGETAIARDPDSAVAHNNHGVALLKLRHYDEARRAFARAIERDPQNAKGYFNRSGLNYQENRLEEALADAQKAHALEPSFASAHGFQFALAAQLCDWRDRSSDLAAIIAHVRAGEEIEPFSLLYAVDDPALHRRAAAIAAGDANRPLTRTAVMPRKRLRIAYLSADFRDHPVSHQAAELFELHDRARVETYAISLWPQPEGPMGERMRKAFDHFIDTYDRSDYDIARRMADLQIDIAVDLGGFSDKSRPQALAYRPAPVTATYLGYPGTIGADYIDYVIADAIAIPPKDDVHYAERVVRLPYCLLPFDSTVKQSDPPSTRRDERLPENGFVFANFNKADKITPEIFDIWMRLLRDTPGSVFWLAVGNATARDHLREEAQARGVAPERLIFAERVAGRAEHLARLSLADLFVDTFPYNAHATASDFLAAGVPLLTCAGQSYASRVATSLLTQVGVPELVTSNFSDFQAEALRLASDKQALMSLRGKIRRRTSEQTARMAQALEDAYFAMWDRRVRGLQPESFDVPAR